jgi:hypothetical protein
MPAAEDPEVDLITVGKPVDDNKAIWDQHELHPANYEQPAGEVFISDMRPYSVYRSPGIQQKLGEKPPALRELRDQDASARLQKHEEAAGERDKQRREAREKQQEETPQGAIYVPPALPSAGPQEAPEGEAEAAAEAAAEAQKDPQAARMRRPARPAAEGSGSGSGSGSAPTPGPAPSTSPPSTPPSR